MTTKTTADFSTLVSEILSGDWDENLDRFADVVKERKDAQSRTLFFSLKPGDRVRLKNLRPKYLVGTTAIVRGHNRTRITVDFDPPFQPGDQGYDRMRSGKNVSVTPDMVELI